MPESLSEQELHDFAVGWYRALEVHKPAAEVLTMVAEDAEFQFPELTTRGHQEFVDNWYEKVIRRFFDEVHTVKEVVPSRAADVVGVKVVVNWQAKVWDPPEPNSRWLGMDAYQTWQVRRSPRSGRPVIVRYVVDDLVLMDGSSTL
jgi:hypothetical protein